MRREKRIEKAEIFKKGGHTMRNKGLKTLVLVVLFTFCTASITWAGGPYTTYTRSSRPWGGGYYYGPTETWGYGGHFKHEEGGTGAQIEKGASGIGRLILYGSVGYVLIREGPGFFRAALSSLFGRKAEPQEEDSTKTAVILPPEASPFFKPKGAPEGTPEDSAYHYYSRDNFVPSVTLCSDAIVPGTYKIPEAQTARHQPRIEGQVNLKEVLEQLQKSGLLVSWCAIENKQEHRYAEVWIDEATPIAQYRKLEPGQTLGAHLTPTESKTEKHTIRVKTYTKTYFGEEDVKTYKGEIGRDAKMHSQWYGCYLELKKDDYKFKK